MNPALHVQGQSAFSMCPSGALAFALKDTELSQSVFCLCFMCAQGAVSERGNFMVVQISLGGISTL